MLRAEAVACMNRALVEQAMGGDVDADTELVKASPGSNRVAPITTMDATPTEYTTPMTLR